jgi:hypothetical protein
MMNAIVDAQAPPTVEILPVVLTRCWKGKRQHQKYGRLWSHNYVKRKRYIHLQTYIYMYLWQSKARDSHTMYLLQTVFRKDSGLNDIILVWIFNPILSELNILADILHFYFVLPSMAFAPL